MIDWSCWDGSHFGDPFEPRALQKRRAYKKWAEMLLQPEVPGPDGKPRFTHAKLYLDKLKIMYGYDVIDHLRSRFTADYRGSSPYISEFQHTDSYKDANQCLQLCDLLTGCMYQELVPSTRKEKQEMRAYLESSLREVGVERLARSFWRQYHKKTLRDHFPKFSAWFWQPSSKGKRKRRKKTRKMRVRQEKKKEPEWAGVIGDQVETQTLDQCSRLSIQVYRLRSRMQVVFCRMPFGQT